MPLKNNKMKQYSNNVKIFSDVGTMVNINRVL